MEIMEMENPNQMWTLSNNGIYQIKMFGEGTPNPLFNALPNSPYLTDGRQVQYIGFFEGHRGVSIFSEPMLIVVLKGSCIADGKKVLKEQNATFAERINCTKGTIVLAFAVTNFGEKPHMLFGSKQLIWNNILGTKFRVYAQDWGDNSFYAAPRNLYTINHAFTQTSRAGTARGSHAGDFFSKSAMLHKGALHMRTYIPDSNSILEVDLQKTDQYYEGYTIHGFCYHSFYVSEDTINTMFVNEPFGKVPSRLPIKALWPELEFTANARDAVTPSEEQLKLINRATLLKL